MNLKKALVTAVIAAALLVPGTMLMAQEGDYYVDIWEGEGDGWVEWDGDSVYVFAVWWIHDYHPYPSGYDNIIEDESGWSGGTLGLGQTGGITGEVTVSSPWTADGEWDTDNSTLHGTWSGIFNRNTGLAEGTWYYYDEYSQLVEGGDFDGTLIRTERRSY